ncbi:MAG: DUF4388 domain-containing protein [Chloroflexi bacterium]|nr:DUF4388 domain-containing protein [Chloroflexota bacterium]
MALKGNLQDFGTAQLFNLIHSTRKTGALEVEHETDSARLHFRDGRLILAARDGQAPALVERLLQGGKITAEQSQTVASKARLGTDKEVGLLLIGAGFVSQDEIVTTVRGQMLGVVGDLFAWGEGRFRFEAGVQPPEDSITVALELDRLILEASRHGQPPARLADELPDLEGTGLRLPQNPGRRLRHVNLTVDEWRVISYINPRNSLRQIARACGLDDNQVRQIVSGLLNAGLVELAAVGGAAPAPQVQPAAAPTLRATLPKPSSRPTRSLIQRIIDRLRRL